jgi:hypothetical protein
MTTLLPVFVEEKTDVLVKYSRQLTDIWLTCQKRQAKKILSGEEY